MNAKTICSSLKEVIKANSTTIMIGFGVVTMGAACVLGAKNAIKANELIKERKEVTGKENLSAKETIETVWKECLPPALLFATGAGLVLAGHKIDIRKSAAFAAAYTISETAKKELEDAAVEMIGEKKFNEIKSKVNEKVLEKDPITDDKPVIVTGTGNTLCYDKISGRYFESNIERIKAIINELNKRLLDEGYVRLNDFYDYFPELDEIAIGDDLGWQTDKGLIEANFDAKIAKDGRPCIVIDFRVQPKFNLGW